MSKKTLTRRLDKICSEIIRSRGVCEKCGSSKNLQCCHIFSRTYRSTRWSLENLLCLCAKCHFWSHKNPILFAEFVKVNIGILEYEKLKETFREITKLTEEELEIKLEILEAIRKDMNEKHTRDWRYSHPV